MIMIEKLADLTNILHLRHISRQLELELALISNGLEKPGDLVAPIPAAPLVHPDVTYLYPAWIFL
jgi:hypothetical protein